MDPISHALWSFVFFHSLNHWYLAVVIGVLPDIISFFPIIVYRIKAKDFNLGPPKIRIFPKSVFLLYDLTHSFVSFVVFFTLSYTFIGKSALFLLAWPLHILIDIPTHERSFFPTKFLYPISNFYITGASWTKRSVMGINTLLLTIAYILIFLGIF